MKDKNSRKKPKRTGGTPFEIGEIRIISNPGPDSEERLRSLFSLIVKYATRDAQAAPEKDDATGADDHAGGGN